MRWEWSDLRYVLAVAGAGSTLAAARALGVNQTTCARRIAALEDALGLRLFDRDPGGYRLTQAGESLLGCARSIAEAAARFEVEAEAAKRLDAAALRVTTNDALADTLVSDAVARFRADHPHVRVTVEVNERLVDLVQGEADIAIRGADSPGDDPRLVRRSLPDSAWGLYCAPSYAAAHAAPKTTQAAAGHPIATLDGAPLAATRQYVPGAHIVDVATNMRSLVALVQAGYCIGAMPCIVGDRAGLVRCIRWDAVGPLWLVYAERLRGRAHARLLIDHLVRTIEAARPALAGDA